LHPSIASSHPHSGDSRPNFKPLHSKLDAFNSLSPAKGAGKIQKGAGPAVCVLASVDKWLAMFNGVWQHLCASLCGIWANRFN